MNNSASDKDQALWFSIFRQSDSWLDWENYIRYAECQTLIPKNLAAQWTKALEFFRNQLRKDFLRQNRHHHPLVDLITGFSPWQIGRIVQYAQMLEQLSISDPDYPEFLKKLSAPTGAKAEAMAFLNIAGILQTAGFKVRFPAIVLAQKNPDLQITDPMTGQLIYGEISRMEESEERKHISDNYEEIRKMLLTYLKNPLYSAIQLAITPFGYSWKLTNILRQLEMEMEDKNHWAEYHDTYFSIHLFPLSQEAEFNSWLTQYNRRKGFKGMPLNFDDNPRIAGYKIREESRHFGQDQAGIIFIPVSILHFWQQHSDDAERSFKRQLQKRPNVIGIYIYSEALHPDGVLANFPTDDRVTRHQIDDSLTRYSIFVRNEAFNRPIHSTTLERIFGILG